MTECDYKRTEIEIREMTQAIRNGKNSIYQVAVRCVKLLNNSADYARAIGIRENAVVQHLNGFLQDFAVDVQTLLELLTHFPSAEQWTKPLAQLLKDARAARTADRKQVLSNTIKVRRSATVAELDAAKRLLQEKEQELEQVKSAAPAAEAVVMVSAPATPTVAVEDAGLAEDNRKLRLEVRRLSIENKQLKKQLADARAENRELKTKRREPSLS